MRTIAAIFITLFAIGLKTSAQNNTPNIWNGKQCAVVLTYDDALTVHLDNALPVLDSLNLKATFYVNASSEILGLRLNEWRQLAKHGHELGNHSLMHPCDGSEPDRSFVIPERDLSKYTVRRAVDEIRINSVLLKAIDGKTKRTFAFPCGDETINGQPFFDQLKKDFVAARGTNYALQKPNEVNLYDVDCFAVNGESADSLISVVNQAMKTHTLLVFLFHGVGGGHDLNVSLEAHSKLLHYLKQNQKNIWIAPMIDVADRIKEYQQAGK